MTCLKTYRSMLAICVALAMLLLPAGLASAQTQPADVEVPTEPADVEAQPEPTDIEAQPAKPPVVTLPVPGTDTVRVYDRPSDDGSAIIVDWPKPKLPDQPAEQKDAEQEQDEPDDDSPEEADLSPEDLARLYLLITEMVQDDAITGAEVEQGLETLAEIDAARAGPAEPQAYYVVEVARSSEDMKADICEKVDVQPSEDSLKSANPKYFGTSSDNENFYYAEITPAELFPPDPPRLLPAEVAKLTDDPDKSDVPMDELTEARLQLLAQMGVLTDDEASRVIATFNIDDPVTTSDIDNLHSQVLEKLLAVLTDAVADSEIGQEDVKLIRKGLAEVNELAEDNSPQEDAELAWVNNLKLYLRILQLHADGVVTESDVLRTRDAVVIADIVAKTEAELIVKQKAWRRAQQANGNTADVANDGPSPKVRAEQALSPAQKGELAWFGRLAEWVTKRDQKATEQAARTINAATYFFRLAVVDSDGETSYVSDQDGVVIFATEATVNLFAWYKLNSLIFAIVFCGIVLAFIQIAKRNPNLFIRKIAGLDAVEEAIGRATEMGRSVYFVHGLGGMDSMATIAAVNVLGRVARRAAEYDTRVQVMNIDPIVTAISQEVVQQAYTEAGRPDAYDPDDVALVASAQFSYAAAVAGRMAREKPAAIFLMGSFMAESLLLAESGAATGAIQVAGTDAYHQLPFFVTTCDYTLIGEELYAASAYLSREPRLLGSIRGQDVGKAFMMIVILLSVVVLTVAAAFGKDLTWIQDIFRVF